MAAREPGAQAPLTETPEFREALQAEIAKALPALLALMQPARAEPGEGDFAKTLALEIAKISGQGTGRHYVDPVIVEDRAEAMKRCKALLLELQAERQRAREAEDDAAAAAAMPAYKLIGKVNLPMGRFGAMLIDPIFRDANKQLQDTEIDWPGMPNLAMEPINGAASRVIAEFHAAIGSELPQDDPNAGPLALNASGAVMRGAAATMMQRNDPAIREGRAQGLGATDDSAGIRRGNDPVKRKVKVLGTLMQPIEVQ